MWINSLTDRLKINWRGNRKLYIDSTIHRCVKKIAGKRVLVKLLIHDENHVKVILIDNEISETFESILTKRDVVELFCMNKSGM